MFDLNNSNITGSIITVITGSIITVITGSRSNRKYIVPNYRPIKTCKI